MNARRTDAAAAGIVAVVAVVRGAVAGGAEVPQLSEQTDGAGLTFSHFTTEPVPKQPHCMTPGAAVADFNRDGWLDVVVQGGLGQNLRLFINNGDGTFTDEAAEWGIDLIGVEGSCVTTGDLDGNGWPDIYAGTLRGRNYLFLNTGRGAFGEKAVSAGVALQPPPNLPDLGNTFGATLGDLDLDGDLDLFTAQWGANTSFGNRLFRNDGKAAFTDITEFSGVAQPSDGFWAFSPSFIDMNGDRFPELIVAADFLTSRYFRNNADSTFTWIEGNGACTDENGMGSAVGDYDNDGDPDWFVTSIFDDDGRAEADWGITGNRLYRNLGHDLYGDATDDAGVRNGFWGWGASFADLNHDGWLDLVMTNGYQFPDYSHPDPTFITDPSRLWISNGDASRPGGPSFTEVARAAGLTHTAPGKGLVTFDADNDGDLDILITTNRGALAYYRNDTPLDAKSWLQITLVSPPGNAPDGLGAVVRVHVGESVYLRAAHAGTTFMGNEAPRLHFGFPPVASIDLLEICWPDGTCNEMVDVATGVIVLGQRGNIDGDDRVGLSDLQVLLNAWGRCARGACPADLDDDGVVGPKDLALLLDNWTP